MVASRNSASEKSAVRQSFDGAELKTPEVPPGLMDACQLAGSLP